MSHKAKQLLIIYHTEAEQWAAYLKSVFTGPLPEDGIFCYNITASLSNSQKDTLGLDQYNCKLLILSEGVLDGFCLTWSLFLTRVLKPVDHVVVLLCGVESLTPLMELLPLDEDKCLQISSKQDAPEYVSTVEEIVKRGALLNAKSVHLQCQESTVNKSNLQALNQTHLQPEDSASATAENVNPLTCKLSEPKVEQTQSTGVLSVRCRTVIVPSRVPCRSSLELFILFKDKAPGRDAEVEFTGDNQRLTVKPVHWNEWTLCVNAPDFPAGTVTVTVYSHGVPLSKALLQYYNRMDEIANLLSRVEDPVDLMWQALQVSTVDRLGERLSSMLLEGMSNGGSQALQCENTPERENHHADETSVRQFGTQYGWKRMPRPPQFTDAKKVMSTSNRHGETSTDFAKSQGQTDLHVLSKKTENSLDYTEDNSDGSVYEEMHTAGGPSTAEGQREQQGKDEGGQDIYATLKMNNECSHVHKSTRSVIANRPPAPTPRPQSAQVMDNRTPFIAQVFLKKTTRDNGDLYSLPTKQAHARDDRGTLTYDNVAANQKHVPKQFVDHQQKEELSQLTARVSTHNQNSIYDVAVPGGEPKNQPVEFYSKPSKGQKCSFLRKTDK